MAKRINSGTNAAKKVISDGRAVSFDAQKPIWRFDMLDKDGAFAFTNDRINHRLVLEKLIEYGNLTWGEIKRQTHDRSNHTKHHFLEPGGFSADAKSRIKAKHLEDDSDLIFSFAFLNVVRVIGIKKDAEFHIVWYDANHEFFPSGK